MHCRALCGLKSSETACEGARGTPARTFRVTLRTMVNLTDFNMTVQEGVSNHFTASSPWPGTCRRQSRLGRSLPLLLPEEPLRKVPEDQSSYGLTASAAYPPDPAEITLVLPDMTHRQ